MFLISKKCKREELHSAVLAGLLSNIDNPGNGSDFMKLFISCLNQSPEFQEKINYKDFDKYEIKLEAGIKKDRIDILITGLNNGKKSIILIENKITDAEDQDNQIPRYYEKLIGDKKNNITRESIKAIVFMPPIFKRPEKWETSVYEREINEKLIILPVFDAYKDGYSLLNNWFEKVESIGNGGANSTFILKQYKQLLENLVKNKIEMKIAKILLIFSWIIQSTMKPS